MKIKLFCRIISFILIQTFLLLDVSWAQNEQRLSPASNIMLSPQMQINTDTVRRVFLINDFLFNKNSIPENNPHWTAYKALKDSLLILSPQSHAINNMTIMPAPLKPHISLSESLCKATNISEGIRAAGLLLFASAIFLCMLRGLLGEGIDKLAGLGLAFGIIGSIIIIINGIITSILSDDDFEMGIEKIQYTPPSLANFPGAEDWKTKIKNYLFNFITQYNIRNERTMSYEGKTISLTILRRQTINHPSGRIEIYFTKGAIQGDKISGNKMPQYLTVPEERKIYLLMNAVNAAMYETIIPYLQDKIIFLPQSENIGYYLFKHYFQEELRAAEQLLRYELNDTAPSAMRQILDKFSRQDKRRQFSNTSALQYKISSYLKENMRLINTVMNGKTPNILKETYAGLVPAYLQSASLPDNPANFSQSFLVKEYLKEQVYLVHTLIEKEFAGMSQEQIKQILFEDALSGALRQFSNNPGAPIHHNETLNQLEQFKNAKIPFLALKDLLLHEIKSEGNSEVIELFGQALGYPRSKATSFNGWLKNSGILKLERKQLLEMTEKIQRQLSEIPGKSQASQQPQTSIITISQTHQSPKQLNNNLSAFLPEVQKALPVTFLLNVELSI